MLQSVHYLRESQFYRKAQVNIKNCLVPHNLERFDLIKMLDIGHSGFGLFHSISFISICFHS